MPRSGGIIARKTMKVSKGYASGALRDFRVALIKANDRMSYFCERNKFDYAHFKNVVNKLNTSDPMMPEYLRAITKYTRTVLGA